MARPFTCFANIRFFITPNMLDDGHDTTINYAANWTRNFLTPLLTNPNFNNNRTLIVITFDENEVNPVVPCAN
jgi:Phosphoesterase family